MAPTTKSDDRQATRPLEYTSRKPRLNLLQKLSIFGLRVGGVFLVLEALESVTNIMYSRARGYVLSVSLYYPIVKELLAGLLAIMLARPFGGWLGWGLGNDDAE